MSIKRGEKEKHLRIIVKHIPLLFKNASFYYYAV